ncbi:GGDEF domain-containing protein [Streptomyces malaysiensis]|uniref:GGDEF domain-containing protein n=1 Tax=Streptomyces malaysiensis TaxID=92644 RepID=UPI0033EA3D21
MTDELTGVLDRRRWDHDASQALLQARHKPWPLALILVDLDRFKDINDLYGHPAGDAVLRATATALRHHSGERGIVGRYGGHTGDEFLILLPDTNLDGALAIAQSIQVHISRLSVQAMTSCDSAVTITGQTVSMGVAACTDLIPGDLSDLLLECDVALRDAKRSGGNQICVAGSQAAVPQRGRSPAVDAVHQLADGDVCIPLARYLRATPYARRSLVLTPESAHRLYADLSDALDFHQLPHTNR